MNHISKHLTSSSNKQQHIFQYLENKTAHNRCSYHNGKIHYKGISYTYTEFDAAFPIKEIQRVTSINNKPMAKNPDPNKID